MLTRTAPFSVQAARPARTLKRPEWRLHLFTWLVTDCFNSSTQVSMYCVTPLPMPRQNHEEVDAAPLQLCVGFVWLSCSELKCVAELLEHLFPLESASWILSPSSTWSILPGDSLTCINTLSCILTKKHDWLWLNAMQHDYDQLFYTGGRGSPDETKTWLLLNYLVRTVVNTNLWDKYWSSFIPGVSC
jgi:hypothetical protein